MSSSYFDPDWGENHPYFVKCNCCGNIIKVPGDCISLGLCKSCINKEKEKFDDNQNILKRKYYKWI